jgi:hypothetical protein
LASFIFGALGIIFKYNRYFIILLGNLEIGKLSDFKYDDEGEMKVDF